MLCNGGVATQFAMLYILETGCVEKPIDFKTGYVSSWFAIAVLGSLSCCCGDTFSSEIGSVVGSGDPWLITTLRRVPRGKDEIHRGRLPTYYLYVISSFSIP